MPVTPQRPIRRLSHIAPRNKSRVNDHPGPCPRQFFLDKLLAVTSIIVLGHELRYFETILIWKCTPQSVS